MSFIRKAARVLLSAYLTIVLTVQPVEAIHNALQISQLCFFFASPQIQSTYTPLTDQRRIPRIHPREVPAGARTTYIQREHWGCPSLQVNFPLRKILGSSLSERVERNISRLSAKLSFLAAPEPINVNDDSILSEGFNATNIAHATRFQSPIYVESNARYLRLSPIKTRRVLQEIRGKPLAAALAHLATSPRRPALAVFRAIESALSNACSLHGAERLKPQLVSVTANNGPVMKRPFFKARGRMNIWRRPTTHIKAAAAFSPFPAWKPRGL